MSKIDGATMLAIETLNSIHRGVVEKVSDKPKYSVIFKTEFTDRDGEVIRANAVYDGDDSANLMLDSSLRHALWASEVVKNRLLYKTRNRE